MPLPNSFKQLLKNDRRKQWKLLKAKHKAAIAKAKLDFDQKLGPALDKYQVQVDKLTKLSAKGELNSLQIQPVLTTVWALRKIVASYRDKVNTLSDPAKKELGALLKAIDADGNSWSQLAVNLQGQTPQGATAAQKKAASALTAPFDHIRAQALMIVTRGERATSAYKKNVPTPRLEAAQLASRLVEAARLAGPSAHEAANAASQAAAGSNYQLFKTRAQAAAPLIQRLRKASLAFKAGWSFDATLMTLSSDIDAMALEGGHNQLMEYCDTALKLIEKLP